MAGRRSFAPVEALETRQFLSAVDFNQLPDNSPAGFTITQVAPASGFVPAANLNAKVSTILNNGSSSNRIDLTIVGDGFTKSDLALYASEASSFVTNFFDEAPLNAYRSFFNVHRVDVISAESGITNDPTLGISRDTALSSQFYTAGIERLLGVDTYAARAYADLAPGDDQTIVIANASKYGGAGYPGQDVLTYAGGNSSSLEIVRHEFGHSFGDLADEYDYGGPDTYSGPEPWEADISTYNAREMAQHKTKWYQWLGSQGVGTYEGADYSRFGIYRPTQNSKMRELGQPYGPVNAEQLILKMYQTVQPVDSATAPGSYSKGAAFTVKPLQPSDHADTVKWYVDGALVSSAKGLSFKPADLGLTGSHTIKVIVQDPTKAVRDEDARRLYMTWTREWSYASAPPIDNTPPKAMLKWGGGPLFGQRDYQIKVAYTDNVAVAGTTLDDSDIVITGPNGYIRAATLLNIASVGRSTMATYTFTAPGGSWDEADTGAYVVRLRGYQISDTSGNYNTGSILGTPTVTTGPSSIGGQLFADLNGNGAHTANEPALNGWTVFLDANLNGKLDTGEKTTVTQSGGAYRFENLQAGVYHVREIAQPGYRLTTPSDARHDVILAAGTSQAGQNFLNTRNVLITGYVFADENSDGKLSPIESGLPNWRVYLDSNGNRKYDDCEITTRTDATGRYAFTTVSAGSYVIRVERPAGWKQTTPANEYGIHLTLPDGGVALGRSFGEVKLT